MHHGSDVCASHWAADTAHSVCQFHTASICPAPCSTSMSLTIYSNPTPNIHCPVSLPTAEPCVKMKPENTEMKQSFIWLKSYFTFSMQSELHW